MNKRKSKRGALMLGLLVVIIIGSIMAIKLLPEYTVIEQRSTDEEFDVIISQIRAAIDIERSFGENSPCKTEYEALISDPDDPILVDAYLQALMREGLLNLSNYKNPAIALHKWGTGPGKTFWKVQTNLIASDTIMGIGSFEAGTENNEGFNSPKGWVNSMPYNDTATFSVFYPGHDSSFYDDHPNQNRLGQLYSSTGFCLKVASYTP